MSSDAPSSRLAHSLAILDPASAKQHMDRVNAGPKGQVVKAKNPAINGSFDEPVRKGRKPEVSKNHEAVLLCRKYYQEGVPLHRVAIQAGVDYTMLARWYDKGWMELPKSKRKQHTT